MELDDPRWSRLHGGYRVPYDPREALARLALGDVTAWDELWEELYHQGDVGEASYAAIPEIVRIRRATGKPDQNCYALAAEIECARGNGGNPPMPDWLNADYADAWRELTALALADFPAASGEATIGSIVAVLVLSKGQGRLARMAMLDETERKAMLDETGWG